MGTNKKARDKDVPEGKNNKKKFNLCALIQIILIPIKIVKLKAKVAIK